jgi:glutamate synthase (ferredoxin)
MNNQNVQTPNHNMKPTGLPPKQGLYDPQFEHDSCGVGFVVNLIGKASHEIIRNALTILTNLAHRGACGCEANTGDGAGILIQIPHKFFKQACADVNISLPEQRRYGVGNVFLPQDDIRRLECEQAVERIVAEEGQEFLGWRTVPTDNSTLGDTAKSGEPAVRQLFIGRSAAAKTELDFERKLYVIRRRAENAIRYNKDNPCSDFYCCSLSCRTLIYKGMLMPEQVDAFFPDLADKAMESALALVHSRFSTNTFPSWPRSHPYRFLAHNGEINTLRGNVNWMRAREAMLESEAFGDDIKKLLPIVCADGSDSAMFDNCFELLVLAGRSLAEAAMIMIPEPWTNHESMSPATKAFYRYHACLMEPWDGPASIAFTDGTRIGAVLDRNGLRPSRYYVTKDDLVIMASEVGVVDIAPDRIIAKGRLQPGRMFMVDTELGRIVADDEIKSQVANAQPYQKWLDKHLIDLSTLPDPKDLHEPEHETVLQRQQAFGYTFEDERMLLLPMAKDGVEAVGSMGTDTPLAVLSNRPQLLYNYFKQLFAQVTNPPIDSIREEIVTSSETFIGSEANLLKVEPSTCHMITLPYPVLSNEELAKLKHVAQGEFRSVILPILYPVAGGGAALEQALRNLFQQADEAIAKGINILILSDRGISPEMAPIPALLAVSGLHHHLIRTGTRSRVGLVLESGEPREVHHFALLIGYGCGAINPYVAFETLDDMIRQGILTDTDHKKACKNYVKAAAKGVVKVISKMGISTIQSYQGAQIFECVGLNQTVVDRYFTGTPSRINGVGLDVLARETQFRHGTAFPKSGARQQVLESGGQYQWRKDGEFHLFNPETINKLQKAVRLENYSLFKEYSALVNDQSENLATLRGLLTFKGGRQPVPIEEVESVETIARRFKTGAMSYGSISQEAHEAMAIAMNRIGC